MTNYLPSSLGNLYPGMVVPAHIYNSNMSMILVPQGSVLTETRIEQLKKFSEGSGKIFVSPETERLLQKRLEILRNAPKTQELEDAIGYTEIKNDAFDILERISHEEIVPHEELSSISQELSHTVEVTAPSIIVDLVSALASADEYLQRHSVNVGILNGLFAKWLRMSKDNIDSMILIGLLHDCGKASIPNKILNAPRPLTVVEFEVIKTHPQYSSSLMDDFPEVMRLSARGHHEKMNGAGYPDGLSGEGIPLMARITAISDIYDAMVSRRTYKNPNSPFRVLSVISGLRETELDGELVELFILYMSRELIGKKAVLSDGRIGAIVSIDLDNLEFPIMEVEGTTVRTNINLHCVSLHYEEKTGVAN